ncbi:MAG: Zn-dependent exopeptidase M28 [Bacteroidetes bacterium]|nr:Zn-dependent exopeptidase M28 [Bacteroidota bacterium]
MTVLPVTGQKDYARSILDTLCSEHFDGRGYVNQGDVRAADFLVDELKRIGVQPVKDFPYEQQYKLNVNTFPYPILVALGTDTLVPGDEYILDPISGSAAGEFELVEINSENFYSTYGGKPRFDLEKKGQRIYAFNFTDVTDKELLKSIRGFVTDAMMYFPAIWVTDSKKTYSVGRSQKNYPMIEIDSAVYHAAETVSLKINNRYEPKYETKNVIGCIPGKKKNKFIVLSAHYDHLGRMGADTYFPGANDNASGCAMLLSLANYYVQHQPDYTVVFCFFSGEEAGLVGSNYFVTHPYFKLNKVRFVLNIDIMGAADKGITVVNGAVHEEPFNTLVAINQEKNYLPEVKKRGAAANSDHYFFSEAGVPAFFIYSMGSVTNYHDIFDTAENTPLTKFDEVQQLIIDFVQTIK